MKIIGARKLVIFLGPNNTVPYVVYDCSEVKKGKRVKK